MRATIIFALRKYFCRAIVSGMNTAADKLSAWIAREGRKKAWLADQIGATSAMVSRWLRCGVVPDARYREAIEKTTGGAVAASDWTGG